MQKWGRRWFLASLAASHAAPWGRADITGKGRTLPSVAARYADPATEFLVLRLTDPRFNSMLPLAGNRGVAARTLLYASDQTGSWQAFQMDLKTWQSKQLTDATQLQPVAISLLSDEDGMLAVLTVVDAGQFLHVIGKAIAVARLADGKGRFHQPRSVQV